LTTQFPQILLVDDDAPFCQLLVEYLGADGLVLTVAHSGETGLQESRSGNFALLILDIMLPDISGLEVLRQVRRESDLPVIMLTARGDDVDRIVGLELGADDYLAKPCNPRELAARVHAILRRARRSAPPADESTDVSSGLSISKMKRTATWRGERLQLTSAEFNILAVLAENTGQIVAKGELSRRALGRSLERYDRSLDMHVSNLRHKLRTLEDGRSPIQTIHGAGYLLLQE
jgi:two-component system OmpR family response regulator